MILLFLFAFISGLITITAPCIWPLLPVVLSSSATGGKLKPFGVVIGIVTSFCIFTLGITYVIRIIPFDPNVLRICATVIIMLLGLSLIIPSINQHMEAFVSKFAGRIGGTTHARSGFWGGILTGVALGIIWTPCAGPIFATIAALAATQSVTIATVLLTIVYGFGIGIPLLVFTIIGNRFLSRSNRMSRYTGIIQKVFGVVMILTALAIATNTDKILELKLLNFFPSYTDSIAQFENNATVKKQLQTIKNDAEMNISSQYNMNGQAPDFIGITHWLNTDKPLSLSDLKGKVVLVDFWTYTCINCIRTLPHVEAWYEKYKNNGLVVIGVHTPEFEFEKQTTNVADAIKRFGIHYPVAQDNNYATWNAYSNEYWPAEYLIDAKGKMRHTHFGEGSYDETERIIQTLLRENGQTIGSSTLSLPDQTPQGDISPETYVGLERMERNENTPLPHIGIQTFSAHTQPSLHHFIFGGTWDIQNQFSTAGNHTQLTFHFHAQHVYLVMRPQQQNIVVSVLLDGKPIQNGQSGKDVKNGIILLDTQRLYDIVDFHDGQQDHVLQLEFPDGKVDCFAFTFG